MFNRGGWSRRNIESLEGGTWTIMIEVGDDIPSFPLRTDHPLTV